jgi:polyferredoxin
LGETLGDEYRTKAPHGPTAKKVENAGQIVLWFAAVISALVMLRTWANISVPGTDPLQNIYGFSVDIVLAGVLGVGVYFFYSGRVWCRFFCPLAALLHLYTRFSIYRIFSDKKRCISCGICTKVCHMGIDVMGYASRGIPMDDVECVRCSSCITSCPMDVLSFGNQAKSDPKNVEYKRGPVPLTPGWASGLSAQSREKLASSKNT